MRIGSLLVVLAACTRPAAHAPASASSLAAELAASVTAHDAARAAALLPPDGELIAIGEGRWSGRAAIRGELEGVLARFPGLRVTIGRTWRDAATEVIEVMIADGHSIGVIGALVVSPGSARLYLDVPTVIGQRTGAAARAPITAPPAGTAAVIAAGTPTERANLAAADQILTRLVAHDPDGVLASASADYIYDDFSGPAPLDRAATRKLLDDFLGQVKDFAIAATPTHFAAGDDVVIEQIEHMRFGDRDVTLHSLDVKHFEEGHVVREWQYADSQEVLDILR